MELKNQLPTVSLKVGVIAAVTIIVLVAAGMYGGYSYSEREGIKRELNASLLRVALNLQAIRAVRESRGTDAIDLISTISQTDLIYLMHFDHAESANSEFIQRKDRVLATLANDWATHPHIRGGRDAALISDPEWQQLQRDLDNYVKQRKQN